MIERFVSLFHDHDIPTALIAVLVCATGSMLFVKLLSRARRTEGLERMIWTGYCGLVGGGTVWTTHFIAILAWRQDLLLGFDPLLTAASLVVAVLMVTVGGYIVAVSGNSGRVELGGLVFGLGIVALHYIGMAGLSLCASASAEPGGVVLSIAFAGFFGVITANRVARPLTRFCRFGGALSFALATLLLHMTGIGALDLDIDLELLARTRSVPALSHGGIHHRRHGTGPADGGRRLSERQPP